MYKYVFIRYSRVIIHQISILCEFPCFFNPQIENYNNKQMRIHHKSKSHWTYPSAPNLESCDLWIKTGKKQVLWGLIYNFGELIFQIFVGFFYKNNFTQMIFTTDKKYNFFTSKQYLLYIILLLVIIKSLFSVVPWMYVFSSSAYIRIIQILC